MEIALKTQESLLTVQELASRLNVKRSWVYDHADELGAYRLGKYVRFSWQTVVERLERRAITTPDVKPPTQRPSLTPINKDISDE